MNLNKTLNELINVCKQKKIKGYSGKKKEEIVKLLDASVDNIIEDIEKVNLTTTNTTTTPTTTTVKRVASLFAGCGGLDFGFHKNASYEHVFINDFDSDACDTYEKFFHMKPTCCDIKKIETIPDCDLLIGGFPCQGFSMANPYRNEKDERNDLYLEILRLLRLKQPSFFLL